MVKSSRLCSAPPEASSDTPASSNISASVSVSASFAVSTPDCSTLTVPCVSSMTTLSACWMYRAASSPLRMVTPSSTSVTFAVSDVSTRNVPSVNSPEIWYVPSCVMVTVCPSIVTVLSVAVVLAGDKTICSSASAVPPSSHAPASTAISHFFMMPFAPQACYRLSFSPGAVKRIGRLLLRSRKSSISAFSGTWPGSFTLHVSSKSVPMLTSFTRSSLALT